MKPLWPLCFALIAAFGNAVFAAGQKKAVVFQNKLSFLAISILVCFCLIIFLAPLLGPTNYASVIKRNWLWALVSGLGLFLTYLGFNLLYTNYGTSNYMLYAALSIITTSIIVGVVIFKETFNHYHWAAVVGSVVTIILFTIGNNAGKT